MENSPLSSQNVAHLLLEIKNLQETIRTLATEKKDLETLLENIAEHSDIIASELDKRNALIQNIFGRYLDSEIVNNLLETPAALQLGGTRQKVTLLTSDLRGFTQLSEALSAEEVIRILNFYLGKMTEIIVQYEGFIDDFIGDGILVVFGIHGAQKDDSQRAIACAIAMQQAMKTINQQLDSWGFPNLEMGIGINTGEVVVGNMGSEKRMKYSVVGSQVNLAFRIESLTAGKQIFISQSTLQEVADLVTIKSQKRVQPKGVRTPLNIYEIQGITGDYNLFLTIEEQALIPLKVSIPIEYCLLEGKHLGDNHFTGEIVKLSSETAEIHAPQRRKDDLPPELETIYLTFINFSEDWTEIYAKVVSCSPEEKRFTIRFTSPFPHFKQFLNSLLT